MQEDGAVLHAGHRREGVVGPVVGQFGVDLVGDHQDVVLGADARDHLNILFAQGGAGGVVGIIEDDGLGLGRDGRAELRLGDAELVLALRLDGDGHAVREGDQGAVRDVAGLVINDLVAGVGDGADGEVEGFADADGDQDFIGRVVHAAEFLFHIGGEGLAQLEQAEVGGVAGRAALQGVDGVFADVPGGGEVRLADAQRDHVLHRADDVEEVADAGAGDADQLVRDVVTGRL